MRWNATGPDAKRAKDTQLKKVKKLTRRAHDFRPPRPMPQAGYATIVVAASLHGKDAPKHILRGAHVEIGEAQRLWSSDSYKL